MMEYFTVYDIRIENALRPPLGLGCAVAAGSQAKDVLNEYAGADYFIPPAFGVSYSTKRSNSTTGELSSQLLEVYPNPADYITTIRIKEALPTTQICRLVIVDLLGREVINTTFNPFLRQVQVNTKDFAEGFYTYKIVIPNSQLQLGGKFEVIH